MLRLDDYIGVIGRAGTERIREASEKLKGKHVVHVNSTYFGGGVAEILNSLVMLMNDLDIYTEWRLLKGSQSFFNVTKKLHNSLQGAPLDFSEGNKKVYFDVIEDNASMMHFEKKDDIIVIHDPQPLGLIDFKEKNQPWIWRCHIDVSRPHIPTWKFCRPMINKYDSAIFSRKSYTKRNLPIKQNIIMPSIDPFSLKNKRLSKKRMERMLSSSGIDTERPIISQISRFDRWKNPMGLIRMFKEIKKKTDCQLVLSGNLASDDPEGPKMYRKLSEYSDRDPDIKITVNKGDLFINSLQRTSDVVFQNSLKEGFALTVSEALWKQTPVIGTNVGGIPLQIKHNKTGFLINNRREGTDWCVKLLRDDELRERIGKNGQEHVRKNFLITRHLNDYLKLFNGICPS